MKSKSWTILCQDNSAKCLRCGAISIWVKGFLIGDKLLTYWKWWNLFKQQHSKCLKQQMQL